MAYLRAWIGSKVFVCGACVALAAVADLLFYGHPMGGSVALFAVIVVMLIVLRAPGLWRRWAGRVMVVLVTLLMAALVEEPTAIAVMMTAVGIGTMVLVSQRNLGDRVSAWLWNWFEMLITIIVRAILDSGIVRRWSARHPQAGGRIVRGATVGAMWVVPLAAGVVFVGLFAVANPIIEKWVRAAVEQVKQFVAWLPLIQGDRVLLWVVVAVGAYGVLRYRRMRVRRREVEVKVPPVVLEAGWVQRMLLSPGMIIRCLVVFNVVFGVQSILDARYLYGGAALPAGMTYAAYAHRGAYTLIATALLAAVFVWVTFTTGGAAHRSAAARRLVYLWVGQNLLLMVSTVWRLGLYVRVYSLTEWRIAAMVWVGIVAAGFVWIVLRIVLAKGNVWLWRVNVGTVLAVLYGCAFVNFGGVIADFNVRHCREVDGTGVPLDVAYLRGLGTAALPAMQWVRDRDVLDGENRTQLVTGIRELRQVLDAEMADWRGWTYRRARLRRGAETEAMARVMGR